VKTDRMSTQRATGNDGPPCQIYENRGEAQLVLIKDAPESHQINHAHLGNFSRYSKRYAA